MIRKTKKGWKIISHKTKRCLGLYPSKKKAQQRLKQIKSFKKRKWEK